MGTKYPDYIYFKRLDNVVKGYCKIINIHDGLITVELKYDHREHTIPNKSLIELIWNAKISWKHSDGWDPDARDWRG